jgi:hypothetical protein
MAQQDSPRPGLAEQTDTAPKSSPQTDPTNPFHQEAVGAWARSEVVSVWKVDEPGLTDRDRQERG